MFTHLDTITPVELKTSEGPKGRFYITPEGKRYPSITTVLGSVEKPWLESWKQSLGPAKASAETKRAADRGTAVHDMAEKYLNNDPTPTAGHTVEHIADFNKLKLKLNKVDNIWTQESALWSDLLQCAGRVDCVAEYNGKLCIIDFKTSTNDKNIDQVQDYFLQTTAYALMFEERYGVQIDDVVIIMSVEKGAMALLFRQPIEPYIAPLIARLNTYHKQNAPR